MRFPRRYRWALAVVGAFGLLAALLAALAYTRLEGRYTRAQYDRIRLGMTPEEVEAVLGPANFDSPANTWVWKAEEGREPEDTSLGPGDWWGDDRGAIRVNYTGGEERRVARKEWYVPKREPFWQRLRRWLGF